MRKSSNIKSGHEVITVSSLFLWEIYLSGLLLPQNLWSNIMACPLVKCHLKSIHSYPKKTKLIKYSHSFSWGLKAVYRLFKGKAELGSLIIRYCAHINTQTNVLPFMSDTFALYAIPSREYARHITME